MLFQEAMRWHPYFFQNEQHSQRAFAPKIALDTEFQTVNSFFWPFSASLCEVILEKIDVWAKKHSHTFGVKTRKIDFVQDIWRGTRNQLLL